MHPRRCLETQHKVLGLQGRAVLPGKIRAEVPLIHALVHAEFAFAVPGKCAFRPVTSSRPYLQAGYQGQNLPAGGQDHRAGPYGNPVERARREFQRQQGFIACQPAGQNAQRGLLRNTGPAIVGVQGLGVLPGADRERARRGRGRWGQGSCGQNRRLAGLRRWQARPALSAASRNQQAQGQSY